jgi:hypothetical protein
VEEQESLQSMTNTIRTMRALVLTLAATAAVSACGGSSGQPRSAPPVSTSPASASASSTHPQIPIEAQAATPAGAQAFARFFYSQIGVAFETKNPDLIKALSAPECESCSRFVESVTDLRDSNERVDHFVMEVSLAVAPAMTDNTARVDVTWSSPEAAVRYDARGKEIYRDGPWKRVNDEMKLTRSGGSWLVTSFRSLRREK